jgi:hypothetical protein
MLSSEELAGQGAAAGPVPKRIFFLKLTQDPIILLVAMRAAMRLEKRSTTRCPNRSMWDKRTVMNLRAWKVPEIWMNFPGSYHGCDGPRQDFFRKPSPLLRAISISRFAVEPYCLNSASKLL